MTSSRKYLSIRELRERESILMEELRLIREEIQRREECGDETPPMWNVKVPEIFFPHQMKKEEDEEERELLRKANEPNKALMLLAKAKIEAGLTENILQKQKKKIIAKSTPATENE